MMVIRMKKAVASVGVAFLAVAGYAVENPVSDMPNASPLVQYNGEYYGLMTSTNGPMMRKSQDLVLWQTVGPIFDAEEEALPAELRAAEFIYLNGRFYLFFDEGVVGVSDHPAGPYQFGRREYETEDFDLFLAQNGAPYCVAQFQAEQSEISRIHLNDMESVWGAAGKGTEVVEGWRGSWNALDSQRLADPEMFCFRNQYALLYAANCSRPQFGQRAIGVVREDELNSFDVSPEKNATPNRQFEPILRSNSDQLNRLYTPLLPTGEYVGWEARYVIRQPADEWIQLDYEPTHWRTGEGGFTSHRDHETDGLVWAGRTEWDQGGLWVRREWEVEEIPKKLVLKIRHEQEARVFLNGRLVYASKEAIPAYSMVDISDKAKNLVQIGDNVVAVQVVADRTEPRDLDFGLYDAGELPVQQVVSGFAEPQVVDGPNGFEKWLTYRAFFGGKPGVGIDRLVGYGQRIVVNGPSTTGTPGYRPGPAKPTFSDYFDAGKTNQWTFSGGSWNEGDGVLTQSHARERAFARLNTVPARYYLFQADVRLNVEREGKAGLVAYDDGEKKFLITLHPAEHTWSYQTIPGRKKAYAMKLPPAFRFTESENQEMEVFHRLRVVRNGTRFHVVLDGISLTPEFGLDTKLDQPARPGLCTLESDAAFDGVIYTAGWDEYGQAIAGWGSALDGTDFAGKWQLDNAKRENRGLMQRSSSGAARAFKGDRLANYEFCVEARLPKLQENPYSKYGVFPVYIDQYNFLRATIDADARELIVDGVRQGRAIGPWTASLGRSIRLEPILEGDRSLPTVDVFKDTRVDSPFDEYYGDGGSDGDLLLNWIYRMPSAGIVTSLDVRWYEGAFEFLNETYDLPSNVLSFFEWYREYPDQINGPLMQEFDESKPKVPKSGILNRIRVRELPADHVGVVPCSLGDGVVKKKGVETIEAVNGRPQEFRVNVALESAYFFRCIKLGDQVHIELNGEPMLIIPGAWPASQVGLFSEKQLCDFNSITLIDLPE